ncbi:hypothetical protein M404DRAFT_994921 [Pisolithus tinctorius Marx 270]|uniref:Uncharacterized protein n=1 Tax=Pisolithus tinctorius Marx 270 TaxID=870435 RepID=A0A0C3PQG6_PISTI|nr:hypothetical protein M404DRAFT_994921 [Pisolithus tinctorius Marx 270]
MSRLSSHTAASLANAHFPDKLSPHDHGLGMYSPLHVRARSSRTFPGHGPPVTQIYLFRVQFRNASSEVHPRQIQSCLVESTHPSFQATPRDCSIRFLGSGELVRQQLHLVAVGTVYNVRFCCIAALGGGQQFQVKLNAWVFAERGQKD